MAKIIQSDIESQTVSTSYSLLQIIIMGMLLGVVYWGLTSLFGITAIPGGVVTIVVAVLGILVMLRLHMAQPLIIALATGASLWGLSQWTSGLAWGEVIIWTVLLYGLAYTLFSWIARYTRAIPVLTTMLIVIIAVHIATAL